MLKRFIKRIEEKSKDNFAAPINIVVLGDSVSQGRMEYNVFDFDNVYHSVLKKMLEKHAPQCTFNIINAAIDGEGSAEGLKRLDRDVLYHFPDLVLVGYCLNDSTRGLDYLPRYIENINAIVSNIRNRLNTDIIIITPNFMASRRNNEIAHVHENVADIIIKCQLDGTLKVFSTTLKRTAEQLNIPVADVYAQWEIMSEDGMDTTAMLCNGLNHPDIQRQKLIAETVWDVIVKEDNRGTR